MDAVKAMRWPKFYSPEQGELLVVDYEWKFTILASFFPRTHLSEEEVPNVLGEIDYQILRFGINSNEAHFLGGCGCNHDC